MEYLKLFRFKHWIKNILIFMPLFFAGELLNPNILFSTFLGFLSFSIMASSIYIVNDISDIDNDKNNPYKCTRPIAAGKVTILQGSIIALTSIIVSLIIVLAFINNTLNVIIAYAAYLLINIAYSVFKFKNIPIVDVFIIAFGFVLRVYFGAAIANVEISPWFYLVIIFGALYLALSKRRGEFKSLNVKKRKVLTYYSYDYLNNNMYMALTACITFYSLWCYEMINVYHGIMITIPVVLLIIFRYNLLIDKDESTGDPTEEILKDKFLLIMGGALVIYLLSIIYIT